MPIKGHELAREIQRRGGVAEYEQLVQPGWYNGDIRVAWRPEPGAEEKEILCNDLDVFSDEQFAEMMRG